MRRGRSGKGPGARKRKGVGAVSVEQGPDTGAIGEMDSVRSRSLTSAGLTPVGRGSQQAEDVLVVVDAGEAALERLLEGAGRPVELGVGIGEQRGDRSVQNVLDVREA